VRERKAHTSGPYKGTRGVVNFAKWAEGGVIQGLSVGLDRTRKKWEREEGVKNKLESPGLRF